MVTNSSVGIQGCRTVVVYVVLAHFLRLRQGFFLALTLCVALAWPLASASARVLVL